MNENLTSVIQLLAPLINEKNPEKRKKEKFSLFDSARQISKSLCKKNNIINYTILKDNKIQLFLPKKNDTNQSDNIKRISPKKNANLKITKKEDERFEKVDIEALYNKIHDSQFAKIITSAHRLKKKYKEIDSKLTKAADKNKHIENFFDLSKIKEKYDLSKKNPNEREKNDKNNSDVLVNNSIAKPNKRYSNSLVSYNSTHSKSLLSPNMNPSALNLNINLSPENQYDMVLSDKEDESFMLKAKEKTINTKGEFYKFKENINSDKKCCNTITNNIHNKTTYGTFQSLGTLGLPTNENIINKQEFIEESSERNEFKLNFDLNLNFNKMKILNDSIKPQTAPLLNFNKSEFIIKYRQIAHRINNEKNKYLKNNIFEENEINLMLKSKADNLLEKLKREYMFQKKISELTAREHEKKVLLEYRKSAHEEFFRKSFLTITNNYNCSRPLLKSTSTNSKRNSLISNVPPYIHRKKSSMPEIDLRLKEKESQQLTKIKIKKVIDSAEKMYIIV